FHRGGVFGSKSVLDASRGACHLLPPSWRRSERLYPSSWFPNDCAAILPAWFWGASLYCIAKRGSGRVIHWNGC
ncbi:MAG: hypothetical protein ACKN9U_02330, partial [Pirellulaceae bacterium]